MMIQHLAVTTHNVVKTERKPRRNIQYRDVSGAVSKTDNLEFLVDVVPKTVQYGAYRKRKAAEEAAAAAGEAVGGEAEGNGGGVGGAQGEKEKEKEKSKGKGKAKSAQQSTLSGFEPKHLLASEPRAPAPPARFDPANDLLAQTAAAGIVVPLKADRAPPAPLPQQHSNGTQLDPLARKELVPAVPETDAMEIDQEKGADSEGEEDPAAMQIEMEMRGPARANGGKEETESATVAAPPPPPPQEPPRMISSGFTAINGR